MVKGIFCLEGDWDPNLRKRDSVSPLLELLDRLGIAKTIRRDVATIEEFSYYAKKWAQVGYSDYPLLYIASHGDHDTLHLGKDSVSLDQVGDVLEGKCRDRVVYFGGCSVLNSNDADLIAFAKRLKAKAVVGYANNVDWLKSAAFELMLLTELVSGSQTGASYRRLVTDHPRLSKELGLVVASRARVFDSTLIE